MKRTDPRAAILVLAVIVLIGGAVFLRLWANHQRLQVPALNALTVSPQGSVHVVVGNVLFIESPDGEMLQRIDLADWGVEAFHGDLTVLADGSIVLAQGRLAGLSARETLRILTRSNNLDDPVEHLMRCHPGSGECSVLAGVQLGRAFAIDAGHDGQAMFVSEPARHRLLKLSQHGEVLAESRGKWRFPNDIRVTGEGSLAFADTNHCRHVEVSAATETFGDILAITPAGAWPGMERTAGLPSAALRDAAGALWMLVADSNMANALLYRIPQHGAVELVELPANADPVELAEAGDTVLVADVRNFRIHRFSSDGARLQDFGSVALTQELAVHRARHDMYARIFDYSLLAVFLVGVPALLSGLTLQRRAQREQAGGDIDLAAAGEIAAYQPEVRAGQHAWATGEFIFSRKWTALSTRAEPFFLLGMTLIFAVAIAIAWSLAPNLTFTHLLNDWKFLALFTVLVLLLMGGWMSKFERLVIDRDGIRCTSALPSPFSRFLQPGWSVKWAEIEGVHLVPGRHPAMPMAWRYVITHRGDRKRMLNPLLWRPEGEPEVGIELRWTARITPENVRTSIQKTALYRVLAARMQERAVA